MNRLMLLAAATTMFGIGKLSHEAFVDPPVNLQATTPGTPQNGHINVNGNVLAGTFYGSSGGTSTKVVSGWATSSTGFVFGGDFRTNSTDGRGIFASALANTGSTYGGDFRSASTTGRGIFGYATSTTGQAIGGDFRSDASSGTGIIGRAMSETGNNIGGRFSTSSNGGTGLLAESLSPSGATFAAEFNNGSASIGSATAIFRANAGVGTSPTVIRAIVTTANGGQARAVDADGRGGYGGRFIANESGGFGGGFNGYTRGVSAGSTNGYGVHADTQLDSSYGVWGSAPLGGTGNAVFASGTFAATGTKALKIDHPDDPENKYLQQFCAEGDTPQLQYRGVVKLDSNGAATVSLPSYFNKINRDPSYQLTPMGAPMPNLYLAQEEAHNEFKIAGGKAGMKVSWTVTGIRNDRYMQTYGAKTELDKPDTNKGTYLMPELYNKPQQLKEGFDPKDDLVQQQQQPVALSKKSQSKSASRLR